MNVYPFIEAEKAQQRTLKRACELLEVSRAAYYAHRAGVPFSLAHPLADRGLGQVEVAGDLPDRAVTPLAQLDDLGLELGRERPARPRLLGFHGLHDGHPPRGAPLMVDVRQSGSGPHADSLVEEEAPR